MNLALMPVLAVSVMAGGCLAAFVGLLAGRLCATHPPYVVWTLSVLIWILAMAAIYSILRLPMSILFYLPVFVSVLPVAYLSARLGYSFSKSRTPQHHP